MKGCGWRSSMLLPRQRFRVHGPFLCDMLARELPGISLRPRVMSELTRNHCSPLGLFPGQRTPRLYDHVVKALRPTLQPPHRRDLPPLDSSVPHVLQQHLSARTGECDANRFLTDLVPSARRWPGPRRIRRLQPCCSSTSTCCLMPTRTDFIQASLNRS